MLMLKFLYFTYVMTIGIGSSYICFSNYSTTGNCTFVQCLLILSHIFKELGNWHNTTLSDFEDCLQVKYLGEDGENTPVAGAVAVCSPWDLLVSK
jgi:hypothetical protein